MISNNPAIIKILDSIYEKRIDKLIPRAVCLNVLRLHNLISNGNAEKVANELISESVDLGLDYYVARFIKLKYREN